MKIGAIIFSSLFIVMTVQPMFINWRNLSICTPATKAGKMVAKSACCKKMAVTKTVPVKKPVQENDLCNTCNPFMPCTACPFIPEIPQEIIPVSSGGGEITTGIYDASLYTWQTDCWHPPELFQHL